jgi:hypothetical protein
MDRERHGRTVIEQLIIYIRRNVIRNLFVTLTLMKRFQTDIFLFENKTYRRQGYLFLFFSRYSSTYSSWNSYTKKTLRFFLKGICNDISIDVVEICNYLFSYSIANHEFVSNIVNEHLISRINSYTKKSKYLSNIF